LFFFTVFDIRDGLPPTAEQFGAKIEEVRHQGLILLCREIFAAVLLVLQERRTTLDAIARLSGKGTGTARDTARFDEFRRQVTQIVSADFLQKTLPPRLAAMCRYLKALRIRLERAQVSPSKDALKAQQVAIHEERYARAASSQDLSGTLGERLREYQEMIEEFKVSLFAQELGTALPVSAKRLDKKWQEVDQLCS
jgi:ATP-dependent helicase HrpA